MIATLRPQVMRNDEDILLRIPVWVCESGVECANIDPFVWERAGQWRGGKVSANIDPFVWERAGQWRGGKVRQNVLVGQVS
jgi:hypothetical protein